MARTDHAKGEGCRTECTAKQLSYLTYLVYNHKPKETAAKELGITHTTVHNWWRKQYFIDKYNELCKRYNQDLLPEALETLQRNLHCGNASAEINAAKEIIKNSGVFIEEQKISLNGGLDLGVMVEYV